MAGLQEKNYLRPMESKIKSYGFKKGLPIELEIKDLSEVKKTPRLFMAPSKATFYQIIWISEGMAVFDIDFKKVIMQEGDVLVISANQFYGFDVESDYRGKLILFTDIFFKQTEADGSFLYTSELFNPALTGRTIALGNGFTDKIISVLEKELSRAGDCMQPYIAQSLLKVFLFQAERQLSDCGSPVFLCSNMTLGRRFLAEVEKRYRHCRNSVCYAQLMGIGEKILAREVKLLTGMSPKTYINSRVLLEAKRLLAYSKYSVKEIGNMLGFDEPTNFNKFFRKNTELTPLEFRQKRIK